MDAAVMIFFVLSGFVIAYVTDIKENNGYSYAVARASRVLSVALPALIATAIFDGIGNIIHKEYYNDSWGYQKDGIIFQYIGASIFINRIWYLDWGVGSNLPYWSLFYEVWYYIIFGVAAFSPSRWRLTATLLLLALVGPNILSLFPIWLLGFVAYRFYAAEQNAEKPRIGGFLGAILCFGAFGLAWHLKKNGIPSGLAEFFGSSKLTERYVIAFLFTAHILGFSAISPWFRRISEIFARPVHWLAGATFTVYLFHLPITQFLTTIMPWPPEATMTRLIMMPGVLALLFLVASLTERRKAAWRRGIEAILSRHWAQPKAIRQMSRLNS